MLNSFEAIEKELLALSMPLELCEGEYLFHQNDYPESIYFIEKGEVLALYTDGSKKLILSKALYGIRHLLLGEPYQYSAIALNDIKLKIMDKNMIMPILHKNRLAIIQQAFLLPYQGLVYE